MSRAGSAERRHPPGCAGGCAFRGFRGEHCDARIWVCGELCDTQNRPYILIQGNNSGKPLMTRVYEGGNMEKFTVRFCQTDPETGAVKWEELFPGLTGDFDWAKQVSESEWQRNGETVTPCMMRVVRIGGKS